MPTRNEKLAALAFPDLNAVTRGSLWKNGIKTAAELRALTDEELLDAAGIGLERLRVLRLKYPYLPDEPEP